MSQRYDMNQGYMNQGYMDPGMGYQVEEESEGISTMTIVIIIAIIIVVLGLIISSIISLTMSGDATTSEEEEEEETSATRSAKTGQGEEEETGQGEEEEASQEETGQEETSQEEISDVGEETSGGIVLPEELVTGAEEEIESKPAPIVCTQDCENGGTSVAGADGKCVCKCVGEWMGPKCAAPVPNTKTFNQVATNCKDRPGYFWNGYDCVKASAGPCGCKTEAGFEKPKCVCANGGTTGFCYAKVGGERNDWVKGTDAKCCAAAAYGSTKVGDPAPWGGAGCVWSGTLADCEKRLAQMGC